ncbi:MAG: hypothetical protein HQK51_20655 [Oligoflexia bacterium]|nr:hypothetical protein [Oligoflexia bacterium]
MKVVLDTNVVMSAIFWKGTPRRILDELQDRLVPEMRLRKIFTIKDANTFFNTVFLPEIFNKNFVVPPEINESSFKPLPSTINLDDHFHTKIKRNVNNDHTINYRGKIFDIAPIEENISGKTIEIRSYPNGDERLFWNDKEIFLKDKILNAA